MNRQIEAMYGRIGQALVDVVGDDFHKAFVRVEMGDDVGSLGMFVDRGDGTWQYMTDDSDTLLDLFAELRGAGSTAGMGTWSQATFELSASGPFSIQFGFDDISDLGQSSARRDAWMKQHLGPHARIKWS